MCGIAGIVGRGRERLGSMLDALAHRGPDARGTIVSDELGVALGHVRLSIIDLDARSNQPFRSRCGRYALTFNGEIYNYVELRERLEALGARFATTSDTEVLLEWLIRFGAERLDELDGMYAFAFLDTRDKTLLLARDSVGEKPLYFSFPRGDGAPSFAFASELPALRALPGVDTTLDREALADWLRFLYTAAPRTLHAGIRELPPGCFMRVALDAPREEIVRWYELEARTREPLDDASAHEQFATTFEKSVRLRMRSDVPVGVFLSGGIDSNAILALARRQNPEAELATYTVRFEGSRESRARDESSLAARAAELQRAPNRVLTFADSSDFAASVERIVDVFGQPFGNSTAILTDQLSAFAVRGTKVCLVGDGGDEVLAGYPRYRALSLHATLASTPSLVRSAVLAGCRAVGQAGAHSTTVRRLEAFTEGLAHPMAESFVDWSSYVDGAGLEHALGRRERTEFCTDLLATFERNQTDPLRAAALVDFRSFVPFNLMQAADRTSMAHALELRTPFLAPSVVELALRVPAVHKLSPSRVKPLLADSFPGLVPDFIARQKKRPFNPPTQSFVRRHFGELETALTSRGARITSHIAPEFVRAELDAFSSGRRDNSTLLFGLATFESWLARG